MGENDQAQFAREGQPAFPVDKEKDNSSAPPAGEKTETGDDAGHAAGGASGDDPDKDKPFHEHPRWKQRETEWNDRFNSQESRHQEDLKKIRDEFGAKRQDNAEQTKIPSWFGGDQEQWDAYRQDRDAEIKASEERAYKRLVEERGSEEKAVAEATDFMNSEISKIEADKDLNPSGAKVDKNALLKLVMDEDLIDSKQRWNYRAGWKMMQAREHSKQSHAGTRKAAAAATTSEAKGEAKPAAFKTSDDFKKGKRPW